MWVDGLYSFTMGGQVVKTATIKGGEGLMTTPGVEDVENEWESESGKMKLKSGHFTNADKRGLEATGKEHYNVEIYFPYYDKISHGVVSEDGKKITMMDGNIFEFMDEEAKKKMSERDPAEHPPNSYNPQPEKMGKILWITGVAGMGKTTTAKFLQEKEGFVNYEGDCFIMGFNPYVGSAPKGSSYFGTRPLSGIPQKRKDICKLTTEKGYMEGVLKGNPVDPKIWEDFYNLLCEDILKERSKIGGMWVVNQAVYTKAAREVIRRKLGGDLTMIALESGEKNLQMERLAKRSLGGGEVSKEAREESEKRMAKSTGGQESVEDDEENTFVIMVTKAMTPEDVAKIALTYV